MAKLPEPSSPRAEKLAAPHLRGLGKLKRTSTTGRPLEPTSCVITGATGVIGGAIVRELCKTNGIHITCLVRDMKRFDELKESWDKIKDDDAIIDAVECDLSSKSSIGKFIDGYCTAHDMLDLLLCCAAVAPAERSVADEDKMELSFVVNVLSYHRLAKGLMPCLNKSIRKGGSRVIYLTAKDASDLDTKDLHFRRREYSNVLAYKQSKAALRVLTYKMESEWRSKFKKVSYFCCHPGFTASPLMESLGVETGIHTSREAALTPLFLATDPKLDAESSGKYWISKRESICRFKEYAEADMLWDIVESMSAYVVEDPTLIRAKSKKLKFGRKKSADDR